ncbi:proline iminopeptidase [Actinocrispum wychmicini]|uniref:Proline iminopeptidase n=2 Tax=Actinocrispum wychmicini TaxID=1213861 RepID=A0A4R2JDC5_9PSEU|nr:proline iminopeptidase [Actinocrispum wychmicini]
MAGSVLLLLSVVLAIGGGVLAFLVAASLTSSITVIILASLVVIAGVAFLLSRLGFALLRVRRSLSVWLSAVVTVLVGVLAAVTVFSPGPVTQAGAVPPGVRYWDLPTGSRIAYQHAPATGTGRSTPVIFLHGGPGTPGEGIPAAGQVLAADGYPVYVYDQVGAGRSSRLADVTQYTVARQVADLEAIRVAIGADQIVLIGQSWGGSLTAQYLAAHPDRVARAVITSPGPIWRGDVTEANEGDPWTEEPDVSLRDLAMFALVDVNPRAAHALVPDAEADSWMHKLALTGRDSTGCPGSPTAPAHGNMQGFYVNQVTNADFAEIPDPRPALRKVTVPTLIMRGECDFIKWGITRDYRRTLPNSTLVYVRGAGHAIAGNQPEVYLGLLRDFLAGRPMPDYSSDTPPN